jgi:hypothetical protein
VARAAPGPRLHRDIGPAKWLAVLPEKAKARDGPCRAHVEDEERLVPLAEHPPVAPLPERGQDGDEVLPLGGELVLVAVPVHAGVDAGQHPVLDEVVEPLRQDVLRGGGPSLAHGVKARHRRKAAAAK